MKASVRVVVGLSLLMAAMGWAETVASVGGSSGREMAAVSNASIIEGVAADPIAMVHFNGNYYMTATLGSGAPPFPIRKAPSILQLTDAPAQSILSADGDAFSRFDLGAEVQWGSGWQPGYLIRWHTGPNANDPYRWYYFSEGSPSEADMQQLHTLPYVLESETDNPMGPYHFKATIPAPSTVDGGSGWGYQPAAFQIDNRVYLTLSSGPKLFITKLTMTNLAATPDWNLLSQADTCWEGVDSLCNGSGSGIPRPIVEGASVAVHGDKIVLLHAANGWELPQYTTGMLTTSVANVDQLDNPAVWTSAPNPVFSSNPSAYAWGPGNLTFFKSPDQSEDWIVYHVKTSRRRGEDRVLQFKRVTWNADNTPNLGAPFDPDTYSVALPAGDPAIGALNVYEAEQATRTQATVQSSPTASGRSYVGGIDTAQSGVTFTVNATQTGIYPVRVYFANPGGSTARQTLSVNGDTAETISYPISVAPAQPQDPQNSSGRFPLGQYQVVNVFLHAGSNELKFSYASGSVQLDRLQVDLHRTGDGMAAVSRPSGTASDLFVVDTAHRLRGRSWTASGGWGAWFTPGSQPAAGFVGVAGAVARGSRVELVAVGRDGDVYTSWWDGSGHQWTSIGRPGPGVSLTGAAAASPAADSFSVFVVGADRQIWQRKFTDAGGWGSWSIPLRANGAKFVSAPTAISRRPNYIDVFATSSDGVVRAMWWDGAIADTTKQWGGFQAQPTPGNGAATSAPSLASRNGGELELVVRGSDNRVWRRRFFEWCCWGTWERIPSDAVHGAVSTGVAATSRPGQNPTSVDVFSRAGADVFTTTENGSPPSWSPWVALGTPDENPVIYPGLGPDTVEGNTGSTTVQFPVTLSAPSGKTITVNYGPYPSSPGNWASYPQDYDVISGTLTFLPGETSKMVTVTIKGDTVDEPDEGVLIGFTNATNATIGGFTVGGLNILDDDPEPVIYPGLGPDTVEGNTGSTTVQFPVTLSAPSGKTITVNYGPYPSSPGNWASYPQDYDVISGTLTFLPGETSKMVTVTIKGDTVDEPDEGVLIGFTNATNATIGGFTVGGLNILDDDQS